MSNLIPINYDNDRQTVSARVLHGFLEVETPYRLWFPRMTEYGFTQETDYTPYNFVHPDNHQEITDHQLTIEMAKELAMLQRTEKGKQARQYFIELEKQWNSPEAVMARALKMADKTILKLKSKIEEDVPKVLFADAVSASKATILIGELAKLIKQNGVDIGEKRLFKWLRSNKYLISRYGTDYNAPTQKSMELELFTVKETTITHSDGHITISKTTKATGKAQLYFINKFLNMHSVYEGD